MDSITKNMAEKWLNAYSGAPAGGNRLLTYVRGILTKAVGAGVIDSKPPQRRHRPESG